MEKVKVRYLGTRPKKVELPIPFTSKSEKRGEVICNPIGEFEAEDAEALFSIPGIETFFELVDGEAEDKPAAPKAEEPKAEMPEGFRSYTGAMKFKKQNDLHGEIKFNKEKKRYEILQPVSVVPG